MLYIPLGELKLQIFDEYEIKARYIPAILSAIPLIMLTSYAKEEILLNLFKSAHWFLIVENVTLSFIIIVFIINIQRFIAKYFFEDRIFEKGLKFPTTEMLLWIDERLSKEYKMKIHNKIKNDFNLKLSNEMEEKDDILEAKKKAKDSVSLIRIKVGKGVHTHQYNIQYGFIRNFIAGTLLSLPIALFNIYLFTYQIPVDYGVYISIFISILDIVFIVFNKIFLKKLGVYYARVLFSEYISL